MNHFTYYKGVSKVEKIQGALYIPSAITLRPEVETARGDRCIEDREVFDEGLYDLPCAHGCQLRRVKAVRVNLTVAAIRVGGVDRQSGGLIDDAYDSIGVREANPNRLREEQKVANFVPGVRVHN